MTGTIFITGAAGLVGTALLKQLEPSGARLKLLLRTSGLKAPKSALVQVIWSNINDPSTYGAKLKGVDTVIHLAATTGKAAPKEFQRINVEGTAKLLEASKRAGVKNFIFVGSIAAGYADTQYYAYAKSKRQAEKLVAESGLRYAILRPTLILGRESSIWKTLTKIATLPIVPLFGGGKVMVQPVDVEDVARALTTIVERDWFDGEVFEFGGKDALTMRAFLDLVHQSCAGGPARFLPLPLKPIQHLLALMEPVARKFLPATAGQLCLFANSSASGRNRLWETLEPNMPATADLIAGLSEAGVAPTPTTTPAQPTPNDVLTSEARVFTAYLCGDGVTAEISDHYLKATKTLLIDHQPDDRFDRLTLAFARRGAGFAWLADSYAALFNRGGMLRRRMALLMSILENSPTSHRHFEQSPSQGPVAAMFQLGLSGLAEVGVLVLAMAIFVPARILLALSAPFSK
jgi:NADH dehydrogenase